MVFWKEGSLKRMGRLLEQHPVRGKLKNCRRRMPSALRRPRCGVLAIPRARSASPAPKLELSARISKFSSSSPLPRICSPFSYLFCFFGGSPLSSTHQAKKVSFFAGVPFFQPRPNGFLRDPSQFMADPEHQISRGAY